MAANDRNISELVDLGSDVQDTDLVAVWDTTAGTTGKLTVAALSDKIEADLGLGTAATTAAADYATAAQGSLATTSVQPGDNISDLTNDENYVSSDALTTSSGDVAAGSIVDVIALTQAQYDTRTQDANDGKKLFVITDGRTEMEALADFFRANPTATFTDFVNHVTTTYPAA